MEQLLDKYKRKLNTELNGIAPSLHTPFKLDKSIDYNSLKNLVTHTIKSECSGMLVGAVAGENENLTLDEKMNLIEFILSFTQNRIPVIVSCSAASQNDRIKLAKIAKLKGARWFLVQVPKEVEKDRLLDVYLELESVGPKNLMIQDLSWNDDGLKDDEILNLYENVKGFKALKIEVLNSGPKYSRILKLTNNKLHLSGGWAVVGLIEAIKRGVHSFIPSTMEVVYNKIYKLAKNNKFEQARELFNKILPIIAFTHQHINIAIMFSKILRVEEGIFQTNICRGTIEKFDKYQLNETELNIRKIILLQKKIKN